MIRWSAPAPSPPPDPESVWDYPRPPRLEPVSRTVRIALGTRTLAETSEALRILETSHPPVYYLPPAAVVLGLLERSPSRASFCEYKGLATYWSLRLAEPDGSATVLEDAAWSYECPAPPYAALRGYLAFYAGRLAAHGVTCSVGGQQAHAQAGDFYGGWITPEIRGPFKGPPGTRGW